MTVPAVLWLRLTPARSRFAIVIYGWGYDQPWQAEGPLNWESRFACIDWHDILGIGVGELITGRYRQRGSRLGTCGRRRWATTLQVNADEERSKDVTNSNSIQYLDEGRVYTSGLLERERALRERKFAAGAISPSGEAARHGAQTPHHGHSPALVTPTPWWCRTS